MRLQKAMRMLYGRFFYRFPNGESAADVYDRITGSFIIAQSFFVTILNVPYELLRHLPIPIGF
jgi:hypothetical protein